jgi:hypothetical protein
MTVVTHVKFKESVRRKPQSNPTVLAILIKVNKANVYDLLDNLYTYKFQLFSRISVLVLRGYVIARRSLSSQRFSAKAVKDKGRKITIIGQPIFRHYINVPFPALYFFFASTIVVKVKDKKITIIS